MSRWQNYSTEKQAVIPLLLLHFIDNLAKVPYFLPVQSPVSRPLGIHGAVKMLFGN
jgi:hypothetical protein